MRTNTMTYTLEMSEQFNCKRPAEDIFDYIVDFSRIDEWDHTIISAVKTSKGAIGLGTKFQLVYSMGLRKIPINYEITEFQANQKAVLTGQAANFTAIDTVEINQNGELSSVNWHAKLVFSGKSAKIVPLIENKIIKAGSETINGLALALEDNFSTPTLGRLMSLADSLVLPGLLNFTKYGYKKAKRRWNPVSNNIKGHHIVITGATSGLGLAAAYDLAHRGATLTLVARDKEKAKTTAEEISLQTGNQNIAIEIADLSETDEVVSLAQRLLKSATPIDVLINNAGALINPRRENSNGLESSFALLLLGPVILTEMLKPLLGKASNTEHASRVINVSSGGMYAKKIEVDNIESTKSDYSGSDAYARSKRGLVMTGEYWAEHWKNDNIVVHNMHPGWAKTPGVADSLPGFNKKMKRFLRSSEQGADSIVWLASATEAGKSTGLFWLDREPHSTHLSNKTRATPQQRQALFDKLREYANRFDVHIELGS